MNAQKILKLTVPRIPGQSLTEHQFQNQTIRLLARAKGVPKTTTGELLANLLKRQAREIMQCVGECQPSAIPANLARLKDCEEIIRFTFNHGQVPASKTERSDKQLLYAHTLADLLECLKLTRTQHRPPLCVHESAMATDLQEINRKLDVIAGAIAHSPELQAALFGNPGGEL